MKEGMEVIRRKKKRNERVVNLKEVVEKACGFNGTSFSYERIKFLYLSLRV